MKSGVFLSLAFLFVFESLLAQKAKFDFEEETFDFGSIKEENGSVSHKFVFSNVGDTPLIIQGVRASCGCTTPAWTKEPVPPGEQGFITAKYNPKNRPGSFRKSLTVTSNADPASKVIYIKGMVETRPRTAADMYRYKIGDLRFRYQSMNMGKVTTEKPFTRSFDVYNDSENEVAFKDQVYKPEHISISFQPNVLAPKTKGKLVVTYNGEMKNDFGYVSDAVKIYTDEEKEAEKSLRVIATIEEYFPPMTQEQLAQAPRMKFEEMVHDFGSMKKNATVHTKFTFTNTGKSPLNIRAVKPNCGCTVSKLDKYDFAPGESGSIEVEFNSTGRRGNQQKSIVIFSNDPSAPTQRLIIKAKVANLS
ncbi:MAG: DUF1573 domain-containing protein [Cytophagales bacterium]|nr:DUF1573 domain-containing protein [Cytophagales bacterium]